MKAVCAGNGQLHQMSMSERANTLDCMHDQQIVMYRKPTVLNSSGVVSQLHLTQVTTKEQEQEMEKNENGSVSSWRDNATTRNKELQILWSTYGEKAVSEWGTGMLELLQSENLLQQGLYESIFQVETKDGNELERYSQICKSEEGTRLLRNLRESRKNGRSPQGYESVEQQPEQSNKAMQKLSLETAQQAENMLDMWESGKRAWILRETLSAFQEIWRSTCNNVPETSRRTQTMKYVLRRLTPLETLRLQGLPDWWCDGADGSDSAIYKMCGNGLAIPCAYDVIRRIAEELQS